ncbi:unnamed protein product [Clonostachys rhizophaga]|uniref:NAD(P)-binding protein n=1 Tax=Clonostachys rhizophaga TaxID=160324 RepID=A0A9N9VFB8_9HYPO|nr:unnamed protein product [Clonostachys rhizophaga]
MPSYLITGASRGLGFEFLRQLSNNSKNTVIGLVRDKKTADDKVAKELNRPNVHIVEADINNYDTLKASADEVSRILGGKLDYLIANAALMSQWSAFDPLGALGGEPQKLSQDILDTFSTNVLGNIHLFNVYVPLLKKGDGKKVLTITSGAGDIELVNQIGYSGGAPYAISKAAMNMVTAKYNAQYAPDGILFFGISPGVVNTSEGNVEPTPEQLEGIAEMVKRFQIHEPNFNSFLTPEESVKTVLSIFDKASLKDGYGGGFVSHLGKGEKWL